MGITLAIFCCVAGVLSLSVEEREERRLLRLARLLRLVGVGVGRRAIPPGTIAELERLDKVVVFGEENRLGVIEIVGR